MCGLFGAIAQTDAAATQCDPQLLTMAAARASTRGPHAHGIAYLTRKAGKKNERTAALHIERQRGPLTTEALRHLSGLVTETPLAGLIGQARLATSGTHRTPENNQPLVVYGVAVAHNGNVYNAAELATTCGVTLSTGNDSEIIAALVARQRSDGVTLAEAVRRAVALLDPRAPLALLVLDSTGLVAARRASPDRPGHPIYRYTCGGVTYLSSRATPGDTLLLDDTLTAWLWATDGTLTESSLALADTSPDATQGA